MKINKYVSVLGIATSLALVSCEDTEPEVLLTDCQQATSVFVDAETLFEEEVTICGTSAVNLQEKLDELEARNTQITDEFNAPEPVPVVPDPIAILNFDDLTNEFEAFGGAEVSIVANPFIQGSNMEENNVLEINNTGNAFEGVASSVIMPSIDFSASSSKTIVLDVYSDAAVAFEVQVKGLDENENPIFDPRSAVKADQHMGTGWERFEIDFNSGASAAFEQDADGNQLPDNFSPIVPEGSFNQLVILIDGPNADARPYYVDNIGLVVLAEGDGEMMEEQTPMPEATSFIRFDDADLDYLGNSFSFGDLSSVNIIENPVPGGSNPESSMVVEAIVDTNLANGFNGFGFDVEAIGLDLFDFSGDNKTFTVSVWSDIPFTLQAQIGNGRDESDVDIISPRPASKTASHSGGGWEDITFDFSTGPLSNIFSNNPAASAGGSMLTDAEIEEVTGTYNSIQFQFNGAPAAAMTTFYIDNVSYN